ncbi:hypothetical protein GF354_01375 [Candidatus Peregrinibacteria bacterium]|nr:hypothetical protein [Candidatus Peregrinibacteria bacterium]
MRMVIQKQLKNQLKKQKIKVKKHKMQLNVPYQQVLEYTLLLSTKKRYTVYEMRKKIQTYLNKNAEALNEEEKAQILEQVASRLIELNYLNDSKFVMDYISEKSKLNPKGKYYFTRELMRKGIKEELVQQYFDENDFEEIELAKRALGKKDRLWKRLSKFDARKKAYRYLSGRGFNSETIYKVVDIYYGNNKRESY